MQPPEIHAGSQVSERPSLVLVGASVRAAARSATRGGYRVIGVDAFGDTDTRELCDEFYLWTGDDEPIAEIMRIAERCPVIQVGDIMQAEKLRRIFPRTENDAGQWRIFNDLKDLCGDDCIRFPQTISAKQPPNSGRWLRKRLDSCGGLGIRWAVGVETNRTGNDPSQLQRWIAGRTFGATLLSNGEQVRLLGVCRAVTHRGAENPFIYGGSIGPVKITSSIRGSIQRFADSIVKRRRLRGLFNVDFVLDAKGNLWMLEINPRWSASMELIELAMTSFEPGTSLIAASFNEESASSMLDFCSCDQLFFKKIHFAKRTETFRRSSWESRLHSQETLHDIPADGEIIRPGHPICTTIERIA
ncbi:MAG: ATP-grasp domain-containing protein [Planctomycetota bacterium]